MFEFQELVKFQICRVPYRALLQKEGNLFRAEFDPTVHSNLIAENRFQYPVLEGYGTTKREALKTLIFNFVMSRSHIPSQTQE